MTSYFRIIALLCTVSVGWARAEAISPPVPHACLSIPNSPQRFATSAEKIYDVSCLNLKNSPACQDVYKTIAAGGESVENYSLTCATSGGPPQNIEYESALLQGQLMVGCAIGFFDGVIGDFGRFLGESAGRILADAEINSYCNTHPEAKRLLYIAHNADVPDDLKIPIPPDSRLKAYDCQTIKQAIAEEHRYQVVKSNRKKPTTYRAGEGILVQAKKMLAEIGIRLDCYNPQKAAELVCRTATYVATAVIPLAAATKIKLAAGYKGTEILAGAEKAAPTLTSSKAPDSVANARNFTRRTEVPPTAAVDSNSGSLSTFVAIEQRAAARFNELPLASRQYIVRSMVSQAELRLSQRGFSFKRVTTPDGFEKLEITEFPGRTGAFLRRYKKQTKDKAAKIEYNPREVLEDGGPGGAGYNPDTHTITVDSMTLALSDQGALPYIKHELRHGRETANVAAEEINGFHGQLYFGGTEGAAELGVYQYQAATEEVLTWERQQLDMMKELRRIKSQIKKQGRQFFANQDQVNSYQSAVEGMHLANETPMRFRSRLIAEDEKIKSGLSSGQVRQGGPPDQPFYLFGRPGKDVDISVTFETESTALGQNRAFTVGTPARDAQGIRLIESDGRPALNFFVVPVPEATYQQALSQPEVARRYILDHLDKMNQATKGAVDKVSARSPESQKLIQELKDLEKSLIPTK